MDLREEYQRTADKIDYFEMLSIEDKQELYKNLRVSEQKELLSILPFQYVYNFIQTYPLENRSDIYKKLNDHQLTAIYNTITPAERQELIASLEQRQIELNEIEKESRKEINQSTSNIEKSENNINQSKEIIRETKTSIKENKQELKQQKIILKKLTKERKKQLSLVLKAKKKTNPLKLTNRIGIISKHRMKKYIERLETLQQIELQIDDQKLINTQIEQQIKDLNNKRKEEENKIKREQQRIKEEHQNINRNVSRISRTEIKITKLSKSEKKLLGKKLYSQTVSQRDCIIVRKKKQQEINQVEKPIEVIKDDQVEVIDPSEPNTQVEVNRVMNSTNKLRQMGVNFYPPQTRINNIQSPSIINKKVTEISNEQLVLMTYTLLAVYNYMLEQQKITEQNLKQGYTRNLAKDNRGVVNFALLMSIIMFIFSIVLFLIK